MDIIDILTPARTLNHLECNSKKRAIEAASEWLSSVIPAFNATQLFTALISREKLGSTGFGDGIAIPHCRIASCKQVTGALIKLEHGIDFDAIDRQPVDIMFILLVPEDATSEHLQVLSTLAGQFGQAEFRQRLRACNSNEALFAAATR
ncbi:MAG TPA: PTS IIA-like nitrogen-regulatory protein PtsN [Oceanospirillaceae bacterium]|nr:PTS IIA-like nitrogen-regulatory protein PtsN [Oceanospirillaceae bacterium]